MVLASPVGQLHAQQPTPAQLLEREQQRQRLEAMRAAEEANRLREMQPMGMTPAGPLLERQISRTEYRLGPGDVVAVSVFGYQNALFSLPVTPEGSIIIPGVRIVQVAGLNIDEAEQRVRQQVRRIYPDSDVGLSLTTIRSFKVFLAGDVPEPGAWSATPVTRVSQLIPPVNSAGIIYRNVRLRRPYGQELTVDLARFMQTGDLSANPTLSQGDLVHVPAIHQTITISGRVAYPGTYEFHTGETLAELLYLANGGGPFPSDAADSLILTRFSHNPNPVSRSIARVDAIGPRGSDLPLEPFDAIFIPRVAHYRTAMTAVIEGEVRRPGRYPIHPGVTAVQDLIDMAGGFTAEASIQRAVLRREPHRAPEGASTRLEPVRSPLEEVSLAQLTREERRSLQVTSRVDEHDILINLSESGPAGDLLLLNDDLLFVPRRRNDVVVLGAAASPGIVPHQSGRTIDYYVELAGGYTRRADIGDVVVEREGLGVRFHQRDVSLIEPGDRIIIPFRERKTFLDHMQTAQLVVGTLSGFALTYFALERIWR
jgi:polysaccharide biosynthesis/export protein